METINASTKSEVVYGTLRLPGFPTETLQLKTTGASGSRTLKEAYSFYRDCVLRFRCSDNWQEPHKILMDFGCGWGRITRFFLRDFDPHHIVGVDVDPELIKTCRETFAEGPRFLQCDPQPPIQFENASVDFIVAYSVFSHLSEEATNNWIKEFARILRPGGMAALTTRGRWFFDHCEKICRMKKDVYSQALAGMFTDFDEARQRYDDGQFVHSNAKGVSGGDVRNVTFYGETFISEGYAERTLSEYLPLTEFTTGNKTLTRHLSLRLLGALGVPTKTPHPIMFFKKQTADMD